MNKYIYLLAVVFGLSGCNDFLELSPTNKEIGRASCRERV